MVPRRATQVASIAVLAAQLVACRPTGERVRDALVAAFTDDHAAASRLCGQEVRGLTHVTVSSLQLGRSEVEGSGTATITATGLAPTSPTCTAMVTFDYLDTPPWSGHRQRGASLMVYDVAIAGSPVELGLTAMSATPRASSSDGLQVPSTVSGSLTASDPRLPDGRAHDDLTIRLTAGQAVTIVVRGGATTTPSAGSTLDMYTFLMLNGVEVTHDDDSAGSLNSRIVYTAPADGSYVVRVTTFGSTLREGAYTVQTFQGAHPEAT